MYYGLRYDLTEAVRKEVRRVPANDLVRRVESWSRKILSILKTKAASIK
jgi:hypothetical protein